MFLASRWKMKGGQLAFYLLPGSGPISLIEVDVGSMRARDEVAVVCYPIRMDIWSELMVVCVCHSDEVMREAMLMIHPENWGWHSQGTMWENLYLRLQSWKC